MTLEIEPEDGEMDLLTLEGRAGETKAETEHQNLPNKRCALLPQSCLAVLCC